MYGGRSFSPSSRGTSGFECPAKRSLDIIGLEFTSSSEEEESLVWLGFVKIIVAGESKGDDRRGKNGRDDKVDKIENSEDK